MTINTLIYEKHFPSEKLRMFIDYYWVAKDYSKTYKYHVLPNYLTYLIFNRSGQAMYHKTCNKSFRDISELLQQPTIPIKSFVVRPHINYTMIETEKYLDVIGVHFNVIGAALLNTTHYAQPINSIEQNRDLNYLECQIRAAKTDKDCYMMLDEYFLARLTKTKLQIKTDTIQKIIEIETNTGVTNVAKLNDTLCLGERQTLRVFNNCVGVTPREYCRIKRFRTALHRLATNTQDELKSLQKIAEENGYSDLAHMVREFKHLSGLTPGYIAASVDDIIFDKDNGLLLQNY